MRTIIFSTAILLLSLTASNATFTMHSQQAAANVVTSNHLSPKFIAQLFRIIDQQVPNKEQQIILLKAMADSLEVNCAAVVLHKLSTRQSNIQTSPLLQPAKTIKKHKIKRNKQP